jgi:hypothetical protein
MAISIGTLIVKNQVVQELPKAEPVPETLPVDETRPIFNSLIDNKKSSRYILDMMK